MFAKEFKDKDAFVYVYEADIQAYLYYQIRTRLENMHLFKLKNEVRLYSFTEKIKEENLVKGISSLLHCQTAVVSSGGKKRYSRQHFDIGFWDEKYVNADKFTNHNEKPALMAIEIKYNWEPRLKKIRKNGFLSIVEKFLNDIDKLKKVNYGYAVWCIPNVKNEKELKDVQQAIKSRVGNYKTVVYLLNASNYYGYLFENEIWRKLY
jgi:hypothetical protein